MQNQTLKDLEPIFHSVFDDDQLVLTTGMSAKDIDAWDSLNHVRLMLAVAKTFKTRFTASEISRLQNVGELADLVDRKRSRIGVA